MGNFDSWLVLQRKNKRRQFHYFSEIQITLSVVGRKVPGTVSTFVNGLFRIWKKLSLVGMYSPPPVTLSHLSRAFVRNKLAPLSDRYSYIIIWIAAFYKVQAVILVERVVKMGTSLKPKKLINIFI